jgi:hypothetical protein
LPTEGQKKSRATPAWSRLIWEKRSIDASVR